MMRFRIRGLPILHFALLSSPFFFCVSFADSRISEAGLLCGTNRSSSRTFIPTFIRGMQSLSQSITSSHFATKRANVTPSSVPIYALAQCQLDQTQTDCLLCFAVARTRLPRCIPSTSGRVYLDGCFLRYDDHVFYDEAVDDKADTSKCSNDTVSGAGFGENVGHVLGSVVRNALEGGEMFGVWGERGVYALAQCWESVGREGCRVCLEKAVREVKRCVPRREGRGLNAGCYLRYSTEKFYNDDDEDGHGFWRKGQILAIILATVAFFMLVSSSLYAVYAKLSKRKQERMNLKPISASFNKSRPKFKYETLEKATEYFDAKRRIGEGGNGTVFKGTLPSGEIVAVKRLVFNTRQWVDEFFNEVNLISGVQHKNLVKLLGCSIEGPESLLVYEYLPNGSLDHLLFDKGKTQGLSWKQRYNIIVGTAEGLEYLHEGARIIHRDIKSGNILLDEGLNAKIADFGLARCLAPDKTHLSTGIAGTLGYMAPEYLVRGQLTEKADVYSFGVLVLEIVCGRRNNVLTPDQSGSLLQRVWKLHRSNSLSEAIDSRLIQELRAAEEIEEACRVLRVGLLCVQATAAIRPLMKEIIEMLKTRDSIVSTPSPPPFLNTSPVLEPESSTRSYSTNSAATKTEEASCSSPGSCNTTSSVVGLRTKRHDIDSQAKI